jgi:hypothetical protein
MRIGRFSARNGEESKRRISISCCPRWDRILPIWSCMIVSMEAAAKDSSRISIERSRRRMDPKSIVFWTCITIENV